MSHYEHIVKIYMVYFFIPDIVHLDYSAQDGQGLYAVLHVQRPIDVFLIEVMHLKLRLLCQSCHPTKDALLQDS